LFGKARKGAASKRGSVAPKYRNPKDASQTWTGRGKRPRWFQALIDSGKKEGDLLIR
jgi:DNA-binding protein H-NS